MVKSELYLDVRYYETDQMGIVHHSNYIRYFECGRTALLKEAGIPMEKIEEAGIMMPVVAVECKYRIPARLGDRLKIVTFIEDVPRAKLTVRSEIFNASDQKLCEGHVVLGFIDAKSRRPIRCPQYLSDYFVEHI